jgi:hypothetical protein
MGSIGRVAFTSSQIESEKNLAKFLGRTQLISDITTNHGLGDWNEFQKRTRSSDILVMV